MSVALELAPLVVYYDPQSVESLNQGLITYRQLLDEEGAFSDFYCHVRFEVLPGCDDRIGSLYRSELAKLVFGHSGHHQEGIHSEKRLTATHLTSESAFFLRACQHPQLEEQLAQTAKHICDISRRTNDSAQMWITECDVFGMLPLFMISIVYPQYAYLLGGYIIPYWDSEHAPIGEDMLALLVSHVGYNRHTLKAFCYCDNTAARARMFSLELPNNHDSDTVLATPIAGGLLGIFRHQPDEFEAFKSLLKHRFSDQDFLQYCDDIRHYQAHPVESFIYTIMLPTQGDEYHDPDEYHQVLLGTFIESAGDEVAAELKQTIEQYLGRSIVAPKPIDDEDDYYRDNYYFHGTGVQDWKAFVTDGFENGSDIWLFVETGETPEILTQITPCDMAAVAKAGNFNIHKKIAYHVGSFESYHAEMASIIYDLIVDWSDEDDGEEMVANNRLKLLRMFDVLHCWNGKQAFHPDFANEIVETYQLLSDEAFIERYNGDWQALFIRHVDEFSGYRGTIRYEDFKRCYVLIERYRSAVIGLITALTETNDFNAVTHMALCAGIVAWDKKYQHNDELSLYAQSQLAENLEQLLYKDLNETSHFVCHTDAKSYSYHTPSSEVIAKAADDWQFVQGYLYQQHDQLEETLVRFEPHLFRYERKERINPAQPYYKFLRNFSDNAQKLLVCSQVLSQVADAPLQQFCTRYLTLWLRIAPCKTARMLAYFFADPDVKKPQASAELVKQFDGLTPRAALAYQIETIIDDLSWDDDETVLLAPFFTQWIAEQAGDRDEQSIRLALHVVLPCIEQRFYIALHKAHPALTITYFDETVQNLMVDNLRREIVDAHISQRTTQREEERDLTQFSTILASAMPLSSEQVGVLIVLCDKYRVDSFDTIYGMAELEELFYHTSLPLQDAIMRLFAARPSLGLELLYREKEISLVDLCQKMYERGADIDALLPYALDKEWYESLSWFANKTEISQHIAQLDVEALLSLLEALARYPEYQPLIDGYASHKSRNVRDLVANIQAGKYNPAETSLVEVVRYGIFAEGATAEELEAIKQEQEESDFFLFHRVEHRKETLLIEVKPNRSFGFQLGYFSDDDNDAELEPELALTVKLHHPYMYSEDGYLSEWTTTISLDRLTYVGWTMSHRALSISGIYRFEIYDPSGVLVVDKTFHVMESKRSHLTEINAILDDKTIDIAHVGSLNLTEGELDFIQYNQAASGLILASKVHTSATQVYRYLRQGQLEMVDIRLNQTQPEHWYVAANQVYSYLEHRVKSKALLLGEPETIQAAQQCAKHWRKTLTKKDPVYLIQPNESCASNVLALHLGRKGMRTYLGYSTTGELCRIAVVNIKFGLMRRLFIRVMNRVARKIINDVGIYKPM
ncbi:hypothetical protein [Photobacterium nomapromontoriensis]|uniref:hypothetical protein n=1 Tax=Photobacterium nomapromontoriensis TaxID=2910237 RepID=UPI003D0A0B2F